MMHMTFYWGRNVTILFDSWRTDSWPSYFLSLLALLVVAAFYQYVEDRRVRFKVNTDRSKPARGPVAGSTGIVVPLLSSSYSSCPLSSAKVASSVLFGVTSAIGYLLMLAIMSFNSGVFIAIVVGLALGYLLFRSGGEEDLVALDNPCACA